MLQTNSRNWVKRNKIFLVAGRKVINKYRTVQSAFIYGANGWVHRCRYRAYGFYGCKSSIQTPRTETGSGRAEREPQISPAESGPAEPALLVCMFSNEIRAYASCPQIYGF